MSGIDRIYNRIIDDATNEAQIKIDETIKKIDLMRAELDEKLSMIKSEQLEAAKKEAAGIIARSEANRNLEGKKQILAEKQRIISLVFDKVHKSLIDTDAKQLLPFYISLIKNSIVPGDNEIILNESDKKQIGVQLINELKKEISSDTVVKLADDSIQNDRGVIVKNGNIYSNSTFSTLLKYKKEELDYGLVEILFERGVGN